jgi:endonuclease/exonuclease/phosphatase (EEP) superfamily protein YafD
MRSAVAVALLVGSTLPVTSGCAISIVPDGTLRHVGEAPLTSLDPDRITVLVWNVYKSSLDGWWRDFEQLVPQYDLVLLQEASWNAESEARYASLGREWWMGVTFVSRWSEGDPATGTVVGSVASVHGATARHSRYLEPVVGTPKSHTFGRVGLDGRDDDLLVMSVHSINFRPDETPFRQHLSFTLRDVAGHDGPAIVAGDFNTWSEWRTALLFDTMKERGFRSVYARAAEPAVDDGRTATSGNYLDHAFVRGLEVVGEPQVLTAIDSSDHEALSFVVRAP